MTETLRLIRLLAVVAVSAVLAWLTWGIFAWAAAMVVGAAVLVYVGVRRPGRGLAPDESADVVDVGSAPNVPFAELLVSELERNGIEAFYKLRGVGFYARSSVTTPEDPCDIYVARRDEEAARAYLAAPTAAATPARRGTAARDSARR